MIRAVLDPGVLVSALISPNGVPARILILAIEDRRFMPIVSPQLAAEVSEVIDRAKFRSRISQEQAGSQLAAFLGVAELVNDPPPGRPGLSRDPDEDYLVTLALATRADHLVSVDQDLIATGLPTLTPRAFLDLFLDSTGQDLNILLDR